MSDWGRKVLSFNVTYSPDVATRQSDRHRCWS